MIKIDTAILTTTSIRYPGGPFTITRRYLNGVVIGEAGHNYVACYNGRVRETRALRPLVGALNAQACQGWVFPEREAGEISFDQWKAALRQRAPLEWRRLLQPYLEQEPEVKIAIEDYSLEDLNLLKKRAWFVGLSMYAPLWRLYALVPARLWETTNEFPRFDGQVRSVTQFGAIYDPEVHRLTWR